MWQWWCRVNSGDGIPEAGGVGSALTLTVQTNLTGADLSGATLSGAHLLWATRLAIRLLRVGLDQLEKMVSHKPTAYVVARDKTKGRDRVR